MDEIFDECDDLRFWDDEGNEIVPEVDELEKS